MLSPSNCSDCICFFSISPSLLYRSRIYTGIILDRVTDHVVGEAKSIVDTHGIVCNISMSDMCFHIVTHAIHEISGPNEIFQPSVVVSRKHTNLSMNLKLSPKLIASVKALNPDSAIEISHGPADTQNLH